MSDADERLGEWARDLVARVDRIEGEPLTEAELALVDRFVEGQLDDNNAEYVAIRATEAWSWENAIANARLARCQVDDARPSPADASGESFSLRFGPIATLAAADPVKTSASWEGGTIRLLQTRIRADLAIELLVDEGRAEEYAESVFVLSIGDTRIALLPNGSPVFSRLRAKRFSGAVDAKLVCLAPDDLSIDQIELLRRAKRNLRDPVDLPRFDQAIARAEGIR